jgi:hypothetical protein
MKHLNIARITQERIVFANTSKNTFVGTLSHVETQKVTRRLG